MKILKSKKFWALVSAVIAAAAGYFTGAVDLDGALQMIVSFFVTGGV